MKLFLSFFLIFSVSSFELYSQDHDHNHKHKHNHEHHENEIGVANAPVYFINEEEISYGLHIHYVRNLSDSKFGIGLGYERIFDEHGHNTFGVVGSYRPITEFVINLSPGVTYEDEDPSELNFALHLEFNYEFLFGDFHIGPVSEFAYDPEDYHISLGLHLGYGF